MRDEAPWEPAYGKYDIYDIVGKLKTSPPMPIWTAVVFAPAAELLVEVKSGGAIARLEVTKPFGYDVEEGGIEADGCTYKGDNNPSLGGIIRFP